LFYYLLLLLCYLLGSVPFSYLITKRVSGIDLRTQGSGNLGATNVFRTVGPGWGLLCLLLDMLKGAGAVLLMSALIVLEPASGELPLNLSADSWRILAGFCASLGHMLSPFMKFKGGKGVATTAGAFFVLAPWPIAIALVVFGFVFAASRIVSLGSISAAAVLPLAVIYFEIKSSDFSWTITIFTLAICLWVILKHRANIRRLQDGSEAKLKV
jgi:acyl phosphate:glycerol-3-phosphate acyltransferase